MKRLGPPGMLSASRQEIEQHVRAYAHQYWLWEDSEQGKIPYGHERAREQALADIRERWRTEDAWLYAHGVRPERDLVYEPKTGEHHLRADWQPPAAPVPASGG